MLGFRKTLTDEQLKNLDRFEVAKLYNKMLRADRRNPYIAGFMFLLFLLGFSAPTSAQPHVNAILSLVGLLGCLYFVESLDYHDEQLPRLHKYLDVR